MHIEGLDELDNSILDVIRNDARLSYSEIGERVGVSRVCVKSRMTALEKRGVIRGYRTVIDGDAAADGGIKFYVDVEAWHQDYETAIGVLTSEKNIREIYTTTGNDHIHCVGSATNQESIRYMANRLYREKTFRLIQFHVILSTLKDVDGGVDYERQNNGCKDPGDTEGHEQ